MKLLWISHFVPYPPTGGSLQRSFNLIRRAGACHELHLLALRHRPGGDNQPSDAQCVSELARHCRSVAILDGSRTTRGFGLLIRALRMANGKPLTLSVSETGGMRTAIRAKLRLEKFDVVHFDTIGLACYRDEIGNVPCVVNHHGAESHMMARRIEREPSRWRRLLFRIEARLLRRSEARLCPAFASNLVVSRLDQVMLSSIAPKASYCIVSNGVDTAYFRPMGDVATRSVIFAGRLDQYSNREAILFFVREVWPKVVDRFPDATLEVIGSNPPKELLALAGRVPSIRVHGFVSDVRPYFARASIAVCPVRDGGGTRVKILDCLAMGKPIVSTSIGIEGLDVVPERDLLVADGAAEFAAQIGRLFDSPALRASVSSSARTVAESKYDWDRISAELIREYARVAQLP